MCKTPWRSISRWPRIRVGERHCPGRRAVDEHRVLDAGHSSRATQIERAATERPKRFQPDRIGSVCRVAGERHRYAGRGEPIRWGNYQGSLIGVTNDLRDRGDCQTPRKSHKTSHFLGWVVGWKFAFPSAEVPY